MKSFPIFVALFAFISLLSPLKGAEAEAKGRALFERVLNLNHIQEPELDVEQVRRDFNGLMRRARAAVDAAKNPKAKIAALNRILLTERNFSYQSNMYWRDATLAASLLRKKGNCMSTATLYLLAAEELNLPLKLVLIPRHAFVRWDDGVTRVNIETTDGGKEYSDRDYLTLWSEPSLDETEKLGWGKSLTDDEAFGELLATAAFHRAGENRHKDALALLDAAIRLQPRRIDLVLRRSEALALLPGKREEAHAIMRTLASGQNGEPARVVAEALIDLAHDAAAGGDHTKERDFLIAAFVKAPKAMQTSVLTELAFCLRALRDFKGAVRYMDLAVALEPQNPDMLYSLAIMQKNSGDLQTALTTIGQACKLNPEGWYLKMLEAGFLVQAGQKEQGMKQYASIQKPRADEEMWGIMQAWFFATTKQKAQFLKMFAQAVETAQSSRLGEWIDQEPDLDPYRNEPEFKAQMEKYRAKMAGK